MADGKVVIDVDLDSKDAEKSVDKLSSKLDGAFQDKSGRWRAANGRFLTLRERAEMLGGSVGKIEHQGNRASLGIGKIVTALGLVALGAKAINMVTDALDGAISRYDTLNNFPNVLQLMGFSAEDSSKAINRLSEGIEGLPTTLDSVASTAQRIAIMTGDLEGATETTLALNNAFLASGSSAADAQRGLEQYVQMLSRGEVDLEAWRTIQETMPVALNETAKAFGFTGASAQNDLYDALKEGNITFDQFNGKLIELSNKTGGFADMAKTSSTGIATSWQNMKTAIVKGVTDVIASVDEALGGVGSIAGIIDNAKIGIKAFFDFIVTNIPVAVAWLATIRDAIEPWVPIIKNAVFVIGTFVGVFATITTLSNLITGVRTAVLAMNAALLANPIVLVIAIIAGLIAVLVLVYQRVDWFRNAVNIAWEWIKNVSSVAFGYIKNVVTKAISDIVNLGKALLDKFKAFWNENGTAIMIIVTSTFNFIKGTIQMVMGIIKGIFQAVWPIITGVVKYAWGAIQTTVKNGIDLILGIIQTVLKILQGDWKGAWNTILSTIKNIWSNITGFLKSVNLAGIGKNIIQGLIKGISSMAGAVKDAVSKVVSGIKEKITSALKIHSPSRWMRDMIGKNMMLGWGKGINENDDVPQAEMTKATGGLLKSIKADAVNLTRRIVPKTGTYGSGSNTTNNNSKSYNPTFNNYFTKDSSTPSEVARKERQQSQRQAMEWGLA